MGSTSVFRVVIQTPQINKLSPCLWRISTLRLVPKGLASVYKKKRHRSEISARLSEAANALLSQVARALRIDI